MKFDRMRMEKEEEIQKQTKVLNAGAVNKKGDCMDIWVFDTSTTIGEFMAMVSTQGEQKEKHAKGN